MPVQVQKYSKVFWGMWAVILLPLADKGDFRKSKKSAFGRHHREQDSSWSVVLNKIILQ